MHRTSNSCVIAFVYVEKKIVSQNNENPINYIGSLTSSPTQKICRVNFDFIEFPLFKHLFSANCIKIHGKTQKIETPSMLHI